MFLVLVRMQTESTAAVSLYCIDQEDSFVYTQVNPEMKVSKKQKTDAQRLDSPLATMKLTDLLGTSFSLNHEDVLRNMRLNRTCEFCGTTVYAKGCEPRTCDFSYPSIIGTNYPPEGSDGRVFACHRGVICQECEKEHLDPLKKYYGCKQCRLGPTNVSDAWGSGIGFPRYLMQPGVIHILSFPMQTENPFSNGEPWELVDQFREGLLVRREHALRNRRNEENADRLVDSAAAYLRSGRENAFSLGSMDANLKLMHSLHNGGLLLEGGGGKVKLKLMLPETIETILRRVDGTVILDNDIMIQEFKLDQSPLRQKRLTVSVWISDFRLLIQSQLMDPVFPAGSFKLVRRGDMVPVLETASGVPVRGSELSDGQRFHDLVQTCPDGTYLLDIVAFSDALQAGSDSYYPTLLAVGNFPIKYREKRQTIMHVAFAEKPQVRKPRHSKVSETLSEEQKVWKQMLQSRTLTQIMAGLEAFSRSNQMFWVRMSDGIFQKISCTIRWGMWQCDGEGEVNLKNFVLAVCEVYVEAAKQNNLCMETFFN